MKTEHFRSWRSDISARMPSRCRWPGVEKQYCWLGHTIMLPASRRSGKLRSAKPPTHGRDRRPYKLALVDRPRRAMHTAGVGDRRAAIGTGIKVRRNGRRPKIGHAVGLSGCKAGRADSDSRQRYDSKWLCRGVDRQSYTRTTRPDRPNSCAPRLPELIKGMVHTNKRAERTTRCEHHQ